MEKRYIRNYFTGIKKGAGGAGSISHKLFLFVAVPGLVVLLTACSSPQSTKTFATTPSASAPVITSQSASATTVLPVVTPKPPATTSQPPPVVTSQPPPASSAAPPPATQVVEAPAPGAGPPPGSIPTGVSTSPTPAPTSSGKMALTSSVVKEGGSIPDMYSRTGAKAGLTTISPPLAWTGAPAGAKAFAVEGWNGEIFWAVYNIPGTASSLPEAVQGVGTEIQKYKTN